VLALAGLGIAATSQAAPLLTIVNALAGNKEVTGDPGGTSFPWVNGAPGGGPGVPSAGAGWPGGAGFAPDPSFGNALGTSGWHGAYLQVSKPTDLTFQYMGKGDSSLGNAFEVFTGGNWLSIFNAQTAPCGAAGAAPVTPTCTPGANQRTFSFTAADLTASGGYVPFRYVTGNGVNVTNNGSGNPDDVAQSPGYFLGVDPYLATGTFQTSGSAVYAGLTDLPSPGDHDYQDFGVRISVVPEPESMGLLGLAVIGLMVTRRRR
jgi:hypothetical protein